MVSFKTINNKRIEQSSDIICKFEIIHVIPYIIIYQLIKCHRTTIIIHIKVVN